MNPKIKKAIAAILGFQIGMNILYFVTPITWWYVNPLTWNLLVISADASALAVIISVKLWAWYDEKGLMKIAKKFFGGNGGKGGKGNGGVGGVKMDVKPKDLAKMAKGILGEVDHVSLNFKDGGFQIELGSGGHKGRGK